MPQDWQPAICVDSTVGDLGILNMSIVKARQVNAEALPVGPAERYLVLYYSIGDES